MIIKIGVVVFVLLMLTCVFLKGGSRKMICNCDCMKCENVKCPKPKQEVKEFYIIVITYNYANVLDTISCEDYSISENRFTCHRIFSLNRTAVKSGEFVLFNENIKNILIHKVIE